MTTIEHPSDRFACWELLEASGYDWVMNYSAKNPFVQVHTVRVNGYPTLERCQAALEKVNNLFGFAPGTREGFWRSPAVR